MTTPTKHPVKRNDDAVSFQDHLMIQGVSLDLDGATVYVVMRNKAEEVVLEKQAHILQTGEDQDQSEPNVEWAPERGAGDLDLPAGVYDLEWHVVNRAGGATTVPRSGYRQVKVVDRLSQFGF